MVQLTTEYFTEQFRAKTTQELMEHISTRELADNAKDAVRIVLSERGVSREEIELLWHDALKSHLRRAGVTNQCDFCGRNIVFGHISDESQRFCSEKCLKEARLLEASIDIAPDLIKEHALRLQHSPCPICKRQRSLVEMRPYYQIVSMIWFVQRSTQRELCCKTCGTRNNLIAALVCLLTGWWSLIGLYETPVRIYRNLSTAWKADSNTTPSSELIYKARLDLAERLSVAGVLGTRFSEHGNGADVSH